MVYAYRGHGSHEASVSGLFPDKRLFVRQIVIYAKVSQGPHWNSVP